MKLIAITWNATTQRSYPQAPGREGNFDELLCAVWEFNGDDESLLAALRYAHGLRNGRVHTFEPNETHHEAIAKAIAAHRNLTEALDSI